MRKYVGFAKDVGQISNTAGSNLIKYLLHRKVFTAEVDTSQEQMLSSHRGSSAAFLPWLVWLNSAGLYNITDHLMFCIFLVHPQVAKPNRSEKKQETAYTYLGSTTVWVISALTHYLLSWHETL